MSPVVIHDTFHSMKQEKIISLVAIGIFLQGLILVLLFLLFFQSKPLGSFAGSILQYAQPLRVWSRSVEHAWDRVVSSHKRSLEGIPLYSITIDPNDLRQLDAVLAQEGRVLSDNGRIWIDAKFEDAHAKYSVEMRVRGDQPNHWAFAKKSWRIKFNDAELFEGMKEINLIIPEDRAWFGAMINHRHAEALGLLQPNMRFVAVSINESFPLLYLEVEHWTREMLERKGNTGNVDFFKQSFENSFKSVATWDTYIEAETKDKETLEAADLLIKMSKSTLDENIFSVVFDQSDIAKWYAHSLLSGDQHVTEDNIRVFFDLSKGRFEPVPWDVHLYDPRPLVDPSNNPLWNRIFSLPEWKLAAHTVLWNYLSNAETLKADLQFAEEQRNIIESVIYSDPLKFQTNREVRADLDRRMEQLQSNYTSLQQELQQSIVKVRVRPLFTEDEQEQTTSVIDLFVLGQSLVSLSGSITLLDGSALYRDTGDLLLSDDDMVIKVDQLGHIVPSSATLLGPKTASGTLYRFFLTHNADVDFEQLQTILVNAVTGHKLMPQSENKGEFTTYSIFPPHS